MLYLGEFMKKILVMSFGSDAGGIEKSLIEFLKFLISEGHDVSLYLWRKPGILFEQIPKEVKIIKDKIAPGSLSDVIIEKNLIHIFWYMLLRIAQKLKYPTKAMKKLPNHYDIAISYCQNGYTPYYIIDKVSAEHKYMWYHHGSYEKKKKKKKIDEKYYLKYEKFITVSESSKSMLLTSFPSLRKTISVINNLVDEESVKEKSNFEVNDINASECKIVTVGRVAPEKGQLFSLEIAKNLLDRGFNFSWYFIGDGPDMKACIDYVLNNGLKQYCHFLGVKENPYPYIKTADIYVQPSKVEAESITIKEAKILQKIIVASDIPAIKEVLEDGKFGCVVPRNAKLFADAIMRVFLDEELKLFYKKQLSQIASNNEESKNKIRDLL